MCQVELIDLENGSRAPGRIDKAAQESAQNAADTMQAGTQSLAQAFKNPHRTCVDTLVSTVHLTCASLD